MTDQIIVPVDDFEYAIKVTPQFTDLCEYVLLDFLTEGEAWETDRIAIHADNVKALRKALKKAVRRPKAKKPNKPEQMSDWPAGKITRRFPVSPERIEGEIYNNIRLDPDGANLHVVTMRPDGVMTGQATLSPDGAFQAFEFLREWVEGFVGLGAVYSMPDGSYYYEQPDGKYRAVGTGGNTAAPLTQDQVIDAGGRIFQIKHSVIGWEHGDD